MEGSWSVHTFVGTAVNDFIATFIDICNNNQDNAIILGFKLIVIIFKDIIHDIIIIVIHNKNMCK